MIAYKCDRCGTFDACDPETCRPKGWLVIVVEVDGTKGSTHLCGACRVSLDRWMKPTSGELELMRNQGWNYADLLQSLGIHSGQALCDRFGEPDWLPR